MILLIPCLGLVSCSNDDEEYNGEGIYVKNAGTLSSLILQEDKYEITNLTLAGYLNGADISFIREMAGRDINGKETDGKLSILDLSRVNIVGGGKYAMEYVSANNSIGDYMFCKTMLASIILPKNIINIGDHAFSYCAELTSVNMSDGVTNIGSSAFAECEKLTNMPIPNSVKSIGAYAFSNTGFTSIVIPENVPRIEHHTFQWSEKLISVTLPSKLTYIADWTFMSCKSLKAIHSLAEFPPVCENTTFYFDVKGCDLYVPRGSFYRYYSANGWKDFGRIIEE